MGEEFEYQNKDILSIQTEIAEEIVTALKINVTPEEKRTWPNTIPKMWKLINTIGKAGHFGT
jgi:hypothetical protein